MTDGRGIETGDTEFLSKSHPGLYQHGLWGFSVVFDCVDDQVDNGHTICDRCTFPFPVRCCCGGELTNLCRMEVAIIKVLDLAGDREVASTRPGVGQESHALCAGYFDQKRLADRPGGNIHDAPDLV